MGRSFVADFEERLLKFEKELKRLVLAFFARKNEGTTYEIGNYLIRQSEDFIKLKKYSHIKSWYRLRKTLESLENESVLRREMSGKTMKNLIFLNYRWIKIGNKNEKIIQYTSRQKLI